MDTVDILGKRYQLATRMERLAAFLLNFAVIVPIALLHIFIDDDSPRLLGTLKNLAVGTSDSWKHLVVIYFLILDGLPNGQSIGKRIIKIQVICETTGKPCTVGVSILRYFVLYTIPAIDLAFVFGKNRQRLGERIAKTRVVKTAVTSTPQ